MDFHRDRRATTRGAIFGPPRSGCRQKAPGRRRLLARSYGYATALRSLPNAFWRQSRSST